MRNILLALILCTYCSAQGNETPRFEVVSIKPAAEAAPDTRTGGIGSDDPGRIAYTKVDLTSLVVLAYPQFRDRISGPSWLHSHFEFVATYDPGTTKDGFAQMMAKVLTDRFDLTFHVLSSDVNGYLMTVAKGGSKLFSSSPTSVAASGAEPNSRLDSNGFPILMPGQLWRAATADGLSRMTFGDVSTAELGDILSLQYSLRKIPVVNRTGLDGKFDFRLELPSPPPMQVLMGLPVPPGMESDVGVDLRSVSPYLEKQIGLRLDAAKIKVDSMIIDHLAKVPTDN